MYSFGVLASEARRRRKLNDNGSGGPVILPKTESYLAVGHKNNYGYGLSIFGLETGIEHLGRLSISAEINCVECSKTGKLLLISEKNSNRVKMFEVNNRTFVPQGEFLIGEYVEGISFSEDDSRLVVIGRTTVNVFNTNPIILARTFTLDGVVPKQVLWKGAGPRLVVGTSYVNGNYLHVYNADTGSKVDNLPQPPFLVKGMTFMEGGSKLLVSYINEEPYIQRYNADLGWSLIPSSYPPLINYVNSYLDTPEGLYMSIQATPSVHLLKPNNDVIVFDEFTASQVMAKDVPSGTIVGADIGGFTVEALMNIHSVPLKRVHYVPGAVNDFSISGTQYTN